MEVERLRRKLIVEEVEIPDLNESNRWFGRVETINFDALNLNKAKEEATATPRKPDNE